VAEFTTLELAIEAGREARMRQRVYPGWVAKGRMSQGEADAQIAKMKAIAERLTAEAARDQAQERLL